MTIPQHRINCGSLPTEAAPLGFGGRPGLALTGTGALESPGPVGREI